MTADASLSRTRGIDTAGRELDVRVVIDVMGWLIAGPGREVMIGSDNDVWPNGERRWYYKDEPTRPIIAGHVVPHFSTDIAAAWTVVEKISGFVTEREDHPEWSVGVFYGQPGQVGCRVYACPPGHSIFDTDYAVIAGRVGDSAAHAICLAALAAVATPRTDDGGRE